ncbi:hypothetical protein [Serratia fonticola]
MNELEEIYRGHKITIGREMSQGGWEMAYFSIFRVADGFECLTDFTTDESPLPVLMKELRDRIDDELTDNNPWGEDE